MGNEAKEKIHRLFIRQLQIGAGQVTNYWNSNKKRKVFIYGVGTITLTQL